MVLEPLFGDCYALWTREQFMLDAKCHELIQDLRGLDHVDETELDDTVIWLVKQFPGDNANGALHLGVGSLRMEDNVGEGEDRTVSSPSAQTSGNGLRSADKSSLGEADGIPVKTQRSGRHAKYCQYYYLHGIIKKNHHFLLERKELKEYNGDAIQRGMAGRLGPRVDAGFGAIEDQKDLSRMVEQLNDQLALADYQHFLEVWRRDWSCPDTVLYIQALSEQHRRVRKALFWRDPMPSSGLTEVQARDHEEGRSLAQTASTFEQTPSQAIETMSRRYSSIFQPTEGSLSLFDDSAAKVEIRLKPEGAENMQTRRMYWYPEQTRDQFFQGVSQRFVGKTVRSVAFDVNGEDFYVEPVGSMDEWMMVRNELMSARGRVGAEVRMD